MDQMEELERRKNDELSKARLEFIKLKNKKEAREFELQQREQLGEGNRVKILSSLVSNDLF